MNVVLLMIMVHEISCHSAQLHAKVGIPLIERGIWSNSLILTPAR